MLVVTSDTNMVAIIAEMTSLKPMNAQNTQAAPKHQGVLLLSKMISF